MDSMNKDSQIVALFNRSAYAWCMCFSLYDDQLEEADEDMLLTLMPRSRKTKEIVSVHGKRGLEKVTPLDYNYYIISNRCMGFIRKKTNLEFPISRTVPRIFVHPSPICTVCNYIMTKIMI